jgi:hypothetical protein
MRSIHDVSQNVQQTYSNTVVATWTTSVQHIGQVLVHMRPVQKKESILSKLENVGSYDEFTWIYVLPETLVKWCHTRIAVIFFMPLIFLYIDIIYKYCNYSYNSVC